MINSNDANALTDENIKLLHPTLTKNMQAIVTKALRRIRNKYNNLSIKRKYCK